MSGRDEACVHQGNLKETENWGAFGVATYAVLELVYGCNSFWGPEGVHLAVLCSCAALP